MAPKITRRVQTHEAMQLSAEERQAIAAGLDLLAFYGSREVAAVALRVKEKFRVV